jgi:copper transport protein
VTRRARAIAAAAILLAALPLVLPAAASAHAYLIRTVPAASVTLNAPPPAVALTFDEAVEPRFAVLSVTDVHANQVAEGPVERSPADPDTLTRQMKKVPEGWYLVYWRAISVDGHPVQGAFTFAVGPNPGPAPQFVIPHISQTATSTPLLVARWAAFLTSMLAIGLLVLRLLIARPLVRDVEGTTLRALSIGVVVASVAGLIAIPVYVEESTAVDSLHSFLDVGDLVPLWRVTAFGRGYVDMWICFALFCAAGWIALWLDRPRRRHRSVAELLALIAALAAAAAVVAIPGIAGHAAQTSPRALTLLADWLHVASGSVWIGGLVGLLVLWRALPSARRVAGLVVVVPRFSNVAFAAVLVLLGSGIAETVLHLPVLAALWETSYGKVILIKIGLLVLACALAAGNLLRSKPRLVAARRGGAAGEGAARLLRRLVGGEAVVLVCAVFAAALLSSLAPPPPAFAKEGQAAAKVGPGRVAQVIRSGPYTLRVFVDPNRAAAPNSFTLELTKGGKPVRGADVRLAFDMLDMEMPEQTFELAETKPGVYSRAVPALVMVGHWGLGFTVAPPGGQPFTALVVDHATG